MRFGRYVAAELGLAATLIFGIGVGSGRALSAASTRWGHASEQRSLVAMDLPPHGEISQPQELAITVDSAGTFLGMSDELLLERARTGKIVRAKLNKGGSSLSFRLDFADGSRAAFKPSQTNLQTIPRKEVAAYRINRLLGLNAVPPATSRKVARDELLAVLHPETLPLLPRIRAETLFDPSGLTSGVVSYWIPKIVDSGLDTPEGQQMATSWLTQGNPIPVEKREFAAQVSALAVFDFLTDNPDRYSGGNMMMSPDATRLYFMDNTMAFFLDPTGHEVTRKALLRTERFSRSLWQALDRLTAESLRDALRADGDTANEILTPSEIRAVVARRDVARQHIAGLVAMHGDRNVLLFP